MAISLFVAFNFGFCVASCHGDTGRAVTAAMAVRKGVLLQAAKKGIERRHWMTALVV